MRDLPTEDRLKVLHIASGDLWAGAEVQIYNLLKQLQNYCNISALVLNQGKLAEKLSNAGIDTTIADESKLNSLKLLRATNRKVREFKPQIIHTHRSKENLLGALACFPYNGINCISSVHGAPEHASKLTTNIKRQLNHFVLKYLHHGIIAVSPELHKSLEKKYTSKVYLVQNGVDTEELYKNATIAEFLESAPDKKHIGFIGRLVPVKRIELFLEIAANFKHANLTSFHFHIIGEGPLKNELQEIVSSKGLDSYVSIHGERNDIPTCIKSLDAVVICSEHEGLPMVALETLALKTKLVLGKNLNISKTLREFGALVAIDNPDGFMQAILSSPDETLEIKLPYTAEQCCRETLKVYMDMTS